MPASVPYAQSTITCESKNGERSEPTFPDTREAGLEAGKGIADDCTADPNGLLFAIVDKHVRRIAEAAGDALNGPHFQHSA